MKTVLITIFMFVGIAALPAQSMRETMASLSYGCRAGNADACGRLQHMCGFLTTEAEKARRNGLHVAPAHLLDQEVEAIEQVGVVLPGRGL